MGEFHYERRVLRLRLLVVKTKVKDRNFFNHLATWYTRCTKRYSIVNFVHFV